METGGPGDDIRICFEGGQVIELQAKRGLRVGEELWQAITRLAAGVLNQKDTYGVLLTTTSASSTVRFKIRNAINRIGQGRTDIAGNKTEEEIQSKLASAGIKNISKACRHIEIVTEDFGPVAGSESVQIAILMNTLADQTRVTSALALLKNEAHQLIKDRGRVDRASLNDLLESNGIQLQDTIKDNLRLNLDNPLRQARAIDASRFPVYIERPQLLEALSEFSYESGVIIGSPGVGKSRLIDNLVSIWSQYDATAFLVPVDQLGDGSGSNLQDLYSLPEPNLLRHLAQLPKNETPNLLIFDAFDVARDGPLRSNVLQLIERAVTTLKGWSVLVSVRHYDAATSGDLRRIFPRREQSDSTYEVGDIDCRGFFVPILSLEEVQQAVLQDSATAQAYEHANLDLKETLRTPFNLRLFYEVAKTNNGILPTALTSSIGLLRLYWRRLVTESSFLADEVTLRTLARIMVRRKSLNAPKEVLPDSLNPDAVQRLLSRGVLVEDEMHRRYSFWHNVIFDYAVSQLVLPVDTAGLLQYLEDDFGRVLYLRPSLKYRAASLWGVDRQAFWNDYKLAVLNSELSSRMYAAVVLPSVIVSEATSLTDLKPLRDLPEALTGALLALHAEGIWDSQTWAEFLCEVEAPIELQQAILISDAASACLQRDPSKAVKVSVNTITRNLLSWALKPENSAFGLVSVSLIPLLIATLESCKSESQKLLNSFLDAATVNDAARVCTAALALNANTLLDKDPDLLSRLFYLAFPLSDRAEIETDSDSNETSASTASNLREYLDGHFLLESLEAFLQKEPKLAGPILIQVLDCLNIIHSRLKTGEEQIKFNYRGSLREISAFDCEYFDFYQAQNSDIQTVSDVFIKHLLSCPENRDRCLDLIAEHAVHPCTYRLLLQTATDHGEFLAEHVGELCAQSSVFLSREFGDYICRLLASCSYKLEETGQLSGIVSAVIQDENDEHVQQRRAQLINCIPSDLRSDKANAYLANAQDRGHVWGVPEINYVTAAEAVFVSYEERLSEQGVRVEGEQQKKLLEQFAPIKTFSDLVRSGSTVNQDFPTVMNAMRNLEASLLDEPQVERVLTETAWMSLIQAADFFLTQNDDFEEQDIELFERIILHAGGMSVAERQRSWADDEYRAGWIPTPHTESAQSLSVLISARPSSKAIEMLSKFLGSDETPLQYLALSRFPCVEKNAPDLFWGTLLRLSTSPNNLIREAVGRSLAPFAHDALRARPIVESLFASRIDSEADGAIHYLVAHLAIVSEDPWALDVMSRVLEDASVNPAELKAFSWPILSSVSAQGVESLATAELYVRLITWIEGAVREVLSRLDALTFEVQDEGSQSARQELTKWLSLVALKLYAAFDPCRFSNGNSQEPLTADQKIILLRVTKPIFELLLGTSGIWDDKEINDIAHHVVAAMLTCAREQPHAALELTAASLRAAKRGNILRTPYRLKDFIQVVDVVFSDRPDVLLDTRALADMNEILMVLVDACQIEALRLLWQLDEAFRQ